MPKNATVLLSGGIDSAACAFFLKTGGVETKGVFVDYRQAAAKNEYGAARLIADTLGIPLSVYRVRGGRRFSEGELVGRNAFLVSSALFLSSLETGLLAIGIHAGTPYFDCSEGFFNSMARLVAEQTDGRVNLVAPFLFWSKKDVFDYFLSTALPLNATYSCEAGLKLPCGKCASCRDRRALNVG